MESTLFDIKSDIRVVNLENHSTWFPYRKIANVYEEEDYGKFTTFSTNREPDHVGRIKANIIDKGWITNPIITTFNEKENKLYIVDGNNRFHALMELGFPIQFIILDGATEEDMIAMNIVCKTWTKQNYVNFYAAKGYEVYRRFIEFAEDYSQFNFSTIEAVLQLSCWSGKNNSSTDRKVERGIFQIKDIEMSIKILEFCLQVRDSSEQGRKVYNKHNFVLTIMRLFKNPNFNPSVMLKKLTDHRDMLCVCVNCEAYRELLEKIYNVRRHGEKVHLDFIR